MSSLSPEQLSSRLQFDWNITQRMQSPLVTVQAFRNMGDLTRRMNPVTNPADSPKAVAYLVEYRTWSLIGAGQFHDHFDVSMDLMAGGNYPYSQPACFVTSRPIPWSPHFYPSNGAICLGELWTAAAGNITLGHLIVHIAKLLNFDEPDREPSYGGWNPKAVAYWRHVMKRQPITSGLAYPTLPPELTHGLTHNSTPLFRPAAVAVPFAPSQTLFRPVGG
jgi:hypothetical protein